MQYFSLSTNVNELRIGNNSSKNIGKEIGKFVVSTMETHSVREMCDLVFGFLGMDYKDHVIQNPKFLRPEELPYLKGDSTKIRTELGWKPKTSFDQLVKEMCTDGI